MRNDCSVSMNNLTYCDLNPVEKVIDVMTTSNYGLPPNWVFMLGGISIIILWCLFLNKIGYFDDAKGGKSE